MANRSLYGRARRDSFLQRWFAKSELHTVASHFSTGNFGNFPKPYSRDFCKFLFAFALCFPGSRGMSFGNFLISQPVLGIFASSGRQV